MESISRTDVAVIGGGLAGLTAAAYLARAGRSVTLLEKASKLGGRAITTNQHGFLFNRGIHAFYQTGPGEAVLKELGLSGFFAAAGGAFTTRTSGLSAPPNLRLRI